MRGGSAEFHHLVWTLPRGRKGRVQLQSQGDATRMATRARHTRAGTLGHVKVGDLTYSIPANDGIETHARIQTPNFERRALYHH